MPRSAEAKLRRRNRKKNDQDEAMNLLGDTGEGGGGEANWEDDDDNGNDQNNDHNDEPIEMFPAVKKKSISSNDVDDIDNLPKKKSSKKKSASSTTTTNATATGNVIKSSSGGIKTTPLILLILMVGTTVLPAIIFASDYLGKVMSKNNLFGTIGYKLGIGSVPKKRVVSFYEKHSPEKINDIPIILSKHYGNYPQLIKKLERKYQDYGYFMGWENDDAPLKLIQEQLNEAYTVWITQYWNQYAPQQLKTIFRNVRYNLLSLKKKGYRIWKKHLWPILEPIFGTPGNAAAQKRKDAADARKRQRTATGDKTRRKSHEFRDDVDE
jgi:hypothetical protein